VRGVIKYHHAPQHLPRLATMATILIAEDDELQAELVGRYLRREKHNTTIVADGRTALAQASVERPDLVILDIMLPELDGFAVCRALRTRGHTVPILMLTARDSEDALLTGLELGADDYVAKPYSPRELVARVEALLRRSNIAEDRTLRIGSLEIDTARHKISLSCVPLSLTPSEFQLIYVLAENAGIVLSRERLLQHLHGSDRFLTTRTIDTHVKNIRSKFEFDRTRSVVLHTVYGVGYTLEENHGD